MPLVNFRIPAVQNATTVNAARSLASLQPIAASTVHLIGWRFRRLTTSIVEWGDAHYLTSSSGVTATHHVRLRTSPNATHLFVAMIYQAHEGESGGSQITLNLYTVAGVLKDGPVTFDTTEGTLEARSVLVGPGILGIHEAPHITAHTGIAEDPPIVDRPRLIVVPSDTRNVDCDLRVTTVNCRLRATAVWELPTQVIT